MGFLSSTLDYIPGTVNRLGPADAPAETKANLAWINAYFIILIIVVVFGWLIKRDHFAMGPVQTTSASGGELCASQLGFNSIRDGFANMGTPTPDDPSCIDTSADMNYALTIIKQNNPTARNSPYWAQYYDLLNSFIAWKKLANEDSTQSARAQEAFDMLKQFEEQTGFNPLQTNPLSMDVISPPVSVVPSGAPAAVQMAAAPASSFVGGRSRVGGFAGGRSKVGGFAGGRSRIGGFVAPRERFVAPRMARFDGDAAMMGSNQAGSSAMVIATQPPVPALNPGMGGGNQLIGGVPSNTNNIGVASVSGTLGPATNSMAWQSDDSLHSKILNENGVHGFSFE